MASIQWRKVGIKCDTYQEAGEVAAWMVEQGGFTHVTIYKDGLVVEGRWEGVRSFTPHPVTADARILFGEWM